MASLEALAAHHTVEDYGQFRYVVLTFTLTHANAFRLRSLVSIPGFSISSLSAADQRTLCDKIE